MGDAKCAGFKIGNVPSRHRGLMAILIFVILQWLLMSVVLAVYLINTQFSQMGNDWLNLAQAVTPDTVKYLNTASTATEDELEEVMKQDGT